MASLSLSLRALRQGYQLRMKELGVGEGFYLLGRAFVQREMGNSHFEESERKDTKEV